MLHEGNAGLYAHAAAMPRGYLMKITIARDVRRFEFHSQAKPTTINPTIFFPTSRRHFCNNEPRSK
ncbi:unnamed protein product, partial [Nesidiocoris tenuis]